MAFPASTSFPAFCSKCGLKYQWKARKSEEYFDVYTGESYRRVYRQLVCPTFEALSFWKKWLAHRKGHGNPGEFGIDGKVMAMVSVKDIPVGKTK